MTNAWVQIPFKSQTIYKVKGKSGTINSLICQMEEIIISVLSSLEEIASERINPQDSRDQQNFSLHLDKIESCSGTCHCPPNLFVHFWKTVVDF